MSKRPEASPTRNRRGTGLWLLALGLAALGIVTPPAARAGATFDGNMSFSMGGLTVVGPPSIVGPIGPYPPGAIVNTFGYLGPVYNYGVPNIVALGNASANGFEPVGALNNTGESGGPSGYATAGVSELEFFNLGNLTGSGGPTPSATVLTVNVNYSFNYTIKTHIDNAGEDVAKEQLMLVVTAGTFSETLIDKTISGNAQATDNQAGVFTLTLPANSVTHLQALFTLVGVAETEVPPNPPPPPDPPLPPPPVPTPEPATWLLAALGGVCLLGRRLLGAQRTKEAKKRPI
jgi:hypothetical protein